MIEEKKKDGRVNNGGKRTRHRPKGEPTVIITFRVKKRQATVLKALIKKLIKENEVKE